MSLFGNDITANVLGQNLAEFCAEANVDFSICWNNSGEDTTLNMVKRKIEDAEGAFYMMDLGLVAAHYHRWVRMLPRVKPFFAIKCNPDDMVIGMLMALGAGFDCASQGEVEVVQSHVQRYLAAQEEDSKQVTKDYMAQNVIYANPIKMRPHMRTARQSGVEWTTFDSIVELKKLAKEWPDAKLVLRIVPPRVFSAVVQFEGKFGACSSEIPILLAAAKQLSLDVVGVSFHVGSGCNDESAWSETIIYASKVFNMMRNFGYTPYLLDLGGGFHGVTAFPTEHTHEAVASFERSCARVNVTLDEYFPKEDNYVIIAEPGRYFVEASYTLATKIIGKHSIGSVPITLEDAWQKYELTTHDEIGQFVNREIQEAGNCDVINDKDTPCVRYYVDDSVYGSFNCNIFDIAAEILCFYHEDPESGELIRVDSESPLYPSKIYGATCDSADCIRKCSQLPALAEGDWIVWRDAGAYMKSAGCPFNGIPLPPVYYYVCSDQLELLPEAASSMLLFHGKDMVLSSGSESGRETPSLDEENDCQADNVMAKKDDMEMLVVYNREPEAEGVISSYSCSVEDTEDPTSPTRVQLAQRV